MKSLIISNSYIPNTWIGRILIFFLVLTLLSPTIQLTVTHGRTPNTITDFFVILLPDIGVVSVFMAFLLFVKNKFFKLIITDYAIISFLIINLVWGGILSDDLVDALKSIRLTYLPCAFYFIARSWNPDKEEIQKVLNVIFLIFVILAIVGWIIWLFFPSLTKLFYYYSGHPVATYFIIRMTSILWTPVLFGTLMAWACYFYYWKFLNSKHFDFFAGLCLIFTFSALVMSVSRGALLSFYLVLIILLPFFKNWKKSIAIFLVLFSLQSLISYSLIGKIEMQSWVFKSTTSAAKLQNKETRVNRWTQTIEDFKARPQGYGLGNAGAVSFNNNDDENEASLSTDGWFLKHACETGWIGLISFALTSIVLLIKLWKNRFYNIDKLGFSVLGLCFIVFIQCFASNVLDFYPYIALIWLIIGLSIKEIDFGCVL